MRLPLFLSLTMLAMVSLIAFANAWPDTFVLDDKPLARTSFFSELSDIPRFFSEDAWATIGSRSGLYRPMLYVSLSLDYQIYGQWKGGYHLSNILLNLLVAILVFGFLRQLLRMTRGQAASSDLYALMAAMIFAAHPVHAEVVNSIFNRSSMLVALGGVGGLWWLLHHLESRPAMAWIGLAICYLFALFSKESAVIIPGLAVILILFLSYSDWPSRIRKCLPVFWLLLPLGFYLLLRDHALTPADVQSAIGSASTSRISGILSAAIWPDLDVLKQLSMILAEALRTLVWPHPMQLYYEDDMVMPLGISLVIHLALASTAIALFAKGKPGLLVGLAFFFIAMLPASRLLGGPGDSPHLNERYLYFPSIGPAIALAFGLRSLGRRRSPKATVAPILLAVFILVPVTWARNNDWASELRLFESEYRHGEPGTQILRLLTAAYNGKKNYIRSAEICDLHTYLRDRYNLFASHCGIAYRQLDRDDEAINAFLIATDNPNAMRSKSHSFIAQIQLEAGNRKEAMKHFMLAARHAEEPAAKLYHLGEMNAYLYPGDRQKLMEARDQFKKALQMQPMWSACEVWVARLDHALEALSNQESEDQSPETTTDEQ